MKKGTLYLLFFILLKMIVQYVAVNPIYELHRDEFLHLDQAKHLAWGYHSVPPLTSWISWLIAQLGNSIFWIRFFPALFGALTIAVVWKTVETLKGSLFACVLSATALLCSALLRMNILFQPNSLDILCYTLVFYTLIRFIQTDKNKWIYLLAISFAVGFLNKYNIAFGMLGLLPAILLSRERRLFLRPQFYLALLLGIALISPNLIWQFNNDFPVLKHMKELQETQLAKVNRADFIKEQFLFFLPGIFVFIAAFISFFAYRAFKPYRLLFFSYFFTIAIFLYLHAKGYYAVGLYPIYFAFGSVYLSVLLEKRWLYYLRYVAILVILILVYPLVRAALPIATPAVYVHNFETDRPFSKHTWEDGKKHPIAQDFADMLGWKELAWKVDSVYLAVGNPQHTFVLGDSYGQAGSINYYTKIKGLQANCYNTDYDRWMNLDSRIDCIIRIFEPENMEEEQDHLLKMHALFDNVQLVGILENAYARDKGAKIYLLSKPKTDINKFLKAQLNR
jgi:hypothetical protein